MTLLQSVKRDLSLSSDQHFLFYIRLAFCQHLVLRGEYVNKTASDKVILQHCQVSVSLSWQILPTDIIVLSHWKQSTAFSDERGEENEKGATCQGQHRDRGVQGEKGRKKSLLLYVPYIKGKPNERLSVCNAPSWRSFKAWNSQIPLKHMIQLTSIFKGRSLLFHMSR